MSKKLILVALLGLVACMSPNLEDVFGAGHMTASTLKILPCLGFSEQLTLRAASSKLNHTICQINDHVHFINENYGREQGFPEKPEGPGFAEKLREKAQARKKKAEARKISHEMLYSSHYNPFQESFGLHRVPDLGLKFYKAERAWPSTGPMTHLFPLGSGSGLGLSIDFDGSQREQWERFRRENRRSVLHWKPLDITTSMHRLDQSSGLLDLLERMIFKALIAIESLRSRLPAFQLPRYLWPY